MAHQGYGFCEFLTEEDAEYACKIMNQIKLWGKPIRVNKVRQEHSNAMSCCKHFGLDTSCLGILRQKAIGCWRQPFHWQSRRKRGRTTAVRHFPGIRLYDHDRKGRYL